MSKVNLLGHGVLHALILQGHLDAACWHLVAIRQALLLKDPERTGRFSMLMLP